MYDYVVMLLFEEIGAEMIRYLKDGLKAQGVKSREKAWPPHITVDLYKGIEIKELLAMIDAYVKELRAFPVYIRRMADFHGKVLYLSFDNEPELQEIKERFDELLAAYRLVVNKRDIYTPHATLAINRDIETARKLLADVFVPFRGRIAYLAVYSRDMQLLKKYRLSDS